VWTIQNSNEVRVVFLLIVLVLILERTSNTFRRKVTTKKTKKVFQKELFYTLLVLYLITVMVSGISFLRNQTVSILISALGVVSYSLAVFLRRTAIRTLNDYWSVFVEVKEGQRYVKEGIYRYLKHPYYIAVILELFGFSLLCNSGWGVVLTFGAQLPLLLIRSHYENRILKVYGKRMGFHQ